MQVPASSVFTRPDLSLRERVVLTAIARGDSTDEVAGALGISPHTVRTYVKSSRRKLGARTRAHAVAIALAAGLIDPDP